jgi:hypothetical protein
MAATIGLSLGTLGASALNWEAILGPKATLVNDLFHALEPPWIFGVVLGKIKRLWLFCLGIDAVMHAWSIGMMHPDTLRISRAH